MITPSIQTANLFFHIIFIEKFSIIELVNNKNLSIWNILIKQSPQTVRSEDGPRLADQNDWTAWDPVK